jgi:hypothetical protein
MSVRLRIRELSHEVHRTDSLLSMITLDLDFDKPPPEDHEIVIDAAPNDGIKEILRSSGAVLPPEEPLELGRESQLTGAADADARHHHA